MVAPFDGSTLAGSFVHDADTDTYSNVNIFKTSGALPAATFTVRQQLGSYFQANANFF